MKVIFNFHVDKALGAPAVAFTSLHIILVLVPCSVAALFMGARSQVSFVEFLETLRAMGQGRWTAIPLEHGLDAGDRGRNRELV